MTTLSARQADATVRPSFSSLLRAELGKLLSQRSQRRLFVVAVILAPAAAAVFCLSLPVTQETDLAATAAPEVLSASVLGIDVATFAAIIFAAVAVGTEYSTGLMSHSLTVTPNRARLLTAKVVAASIPCLVIGIIASALVAITAGLAVSGTGRAFADIFDGGGVQLLAGSVVMPFFYGALAILAGFVFRTTAGGILVPTAILVLAAIAGWFGSGVGDAITPITPLAGLHSISGIAEGSEDVGVIRGSVTLVIWILVAYGIARWRFTRKDA